MKMEKKPIFETMEFDDAAYAQSVITDSEMALKRNTIAIVLAVLASLCIFGLGLGAYVPYQVTDVIQYIGVVLMVASYIVTGGFKIFLKIIKFVWKVIVIGWWIVPIFPIDLIVAVLAFCGAGAVVLYTPIVFVLVTRYQICKDKKDAEAYLSFCKPADVAVADVETTSDVEENN